jgi:hypothetical protein
MGKAAKERADGYQRALYSPLNFGTAERCFASLIKKLLGASIYINQKAAPLQAPVLIEY